MALPEPPCPTNETTPVELETASALCSTFLSPLVITGALLKLLQEHFANPDNLIYNGSSENGKKQLQGYVWHPDNKETKIQIQTVFKYNVQDIQRRPALYLKRNQWTTQRVAINDGMTVNATKSNDGLGKEVQGEYHSRQVTGSHTIFCVGGVDEGAEAELLGAEVFDFIMSFAPMLRQELRLHRFEVQSVEPIGILDESAEHFVVPVVVSYSFFWTWRLNQVAPWLKSLSIALSADKC